MIAATFQLALTELAAKLGLIPRARKHLDAARALVVRVDDKAIQADLKLLDVAFAALESDFGGALQHALDLVPMVEETGYAAKLALPINLGHLLSVQARFDEARKVLERGLDEDKFGGGGKVALLDTLLQLRLFQGDLEESEVLAESIRQLLEDPETSDSYFGLWHLLNRVKWLYRAGEIQEGVDLALASIPRIKRMADRNLLERVTLLAAEGIGRAGDTAKGAQLVAAAWHANPEPSLDTLAEASRIAGRLTATEDIDAALAHFLRAQRIMHQIGNLAAVAEVQRDLLETLPAIESPQLGMGVASKALAANAGREKSVERGTTLPQSEALTTERIATLIELGSDSALLAAEALSLLVDTRSVLAAAIVTTDGSGLRSFAAAYRAAESHGADDDDHNAVRIELGTHRNLQYEIVATPQPTSRARITLLAIERLVHSALALARARQMAREQAALWPDHPEQQLGLICASERMLDLTKTIRRVAGSNITVLLVGETGVGKELFARALHQASARSDRVFMPFNCSAVPRDMFDSQLFGHKRGSFTGAHEDAPGVIRSASGGTLFLDEIGEMSMDVQPKLLRFLESGEVQPLGDPKPRLVDVRIVAATNANLDQLVAGGRFREDLYYRLNVIRINIPPLRERREEIPALVEHFLEKFGREMQKPMLRIADETLEYLVLYRWPGNVRQLSNEIRRMVALAEPGSVLMPAHLSDDIAASRRTIAVDAPPRQSTEVVTRIDQPLAAAVEHIERAAIQRAITLADGRLDDAARSLGLSRKGLYLKRQRLKLD